MSKLLIWTTILCFLHCTCDPVSARTCLVAAWAMVIPLSPLSQVYTLLLLYEMLMCAGNKLN